MMNRIQKFNSAWFNFKPMVANYLDIEISEVRSDSSWLELGVDSLDKIELIMMIEEQYNVEFSEQEVDAIKTLGGLHILLIRTLEGKREVEITHRDTIEERASGFCKCCGRG
jgi:acyl carrier protein